MNTDKKSGDGVFGKVDKSLNKVTNTVQKMQSSRPVKVVSAAGKAVGKVASAVGAAADKATDSIDNDVVQFGKKSYTVLSSVVKLKVGGTVKTVKLAGKTIRGGIKLGASIERKVQKAKLSKMKTKGLDKAVEKKFVNLKKFKLADKKKVDKLGKAVKNARRIKKAKKAAEFAKKHVIYPAKKVIKKSASAADGVIENVAGKIDNDTVQFAKKAYDVAKAGVAVTGKAAKLGGRTIKGAVKTTRTLVTKCGRKRLVKSIKRSVQRVKRNIRRVKQIAKVIGKAAKVIAKAAAKAAKAVGKAIVKLVQLIASTAPWSLIIIAVIALIIIAINVVIAICGDEEEGGTAGLRSESGDIDEVYENLEKFEEMFAEASKENITDPLNTTVTGFCTPKEDPQNIIAFNGSVYFPAAGKADTVNSLTENYVDSSISQDRYVTFLAVLKVLEERETGERSDLFTKSDFKTLIGTVNGNTCVYGDACDTFFIKTTVTTTGETCPGAACKTRYCDGCQTRTNSDGETETYCPGHSYCDHDHTKLTILLKTVEEYSGKSVAEIYNFDDEEEYKFEDYKYIIESLIEEMKTVPDYSYVPPSPTNSDAVDDTSYVTPENFIVSNRDWILIAALVAALIFGLMANRKG